MSIQATRDLIRIHKRKPNAEAMWDGALEQTRVCAAAAAKLSGFAAANAYLACRTGKYAIEKQGLFTVK